MASSHDPFLSSREFNFRRNPRSRGAEEEEEITGRKHRLAIKKLSLYHRTCSQRRRIGTHTKMCLFLATNPNKVTTDAHIYPPFSLEERSRVPKSAPPPLLLLLLCPAVGESAAALFVPRVRNQISSSSSVAERRRRRAKPRPAPLFLCVLLLSSPYFRGKRERVLLHHAVRRIEVVK